MDVRTDFPAHLVTSCLQACCEILCVQGTKPPMMAMDLASAAFEASRDKKGVRLSCSHTGHVAAAGSPHEHSLAVNDLGVRVPRHCARALLGRSECLAAKAHPHVQPSTGMKTILCPLLWS